MAPSPTVDEDGWMTVKRGGKKVDMGMVTPIRRGPDNSITLDHLQKDFKNYSAIWKRSDCREKLLRILERNQSDAIFDIKTAVCLASGSFTAFDFEGRKRSMLQFVCVVDFAHYIGEISKTEVQIYAQEPMYSDVDKAFIASQGVSVLDVEIAYEGGLAVGSLGPAATLLGPQTVLFEFFMDMGREQVRELVSGQARLYVGSSFLRHAKTGLSFLERQGDDVKVEVERFQKVHAQRWFPNFEEDPNVFKGLMVYWKESQDSDLEGDEE